MTERDPDGLDDDDDEIDRLAELPPGFRSISLAEVCFVCPQARNNIKLSKLLFLLNRLSLEQQAQLTQQVQVQAWGKSWCLPS